MYGTDVGKAVAAKARQAQNPAQIILPYLPCVTKTLNYWGKDNDHCYT